MPELTWATKGQCTIERPGRSPTQAIQFHDRSVRSTP